MIYYLSLKGSDGCFNARMSLFLGNFSEGGFYYKYHKKNNLTMSLEQFPSSYSILCQNQLELDGNCC